jgi:hypothetical protein
MKSTHFISVLVTSPADVLTPCVSLAESRRWALRDSDLRAGNGVIEGNETSDKTTISISPDVQEAKHARFSNEA